MILRRLRLRVGIYASALLLLCGLTLAVQATEPITRSQAQAMIDGRLAAAGVLVFGAFWVLLLTISGRSEKALTASVLRLEKAVDDFKRALDAHDTSLFAHGPASEHNHAPLMVEIEKVKTDVERVEREAERIESGLEDFIRFCKTHQCSLGRRNPDDSPNHRRDEDPKDFDGRPLRGKQ